MYGRLFLLALLAGCGASHALPSPGAASLPASGVLTSSPIQHVVLVIQENRSFDNLFATFPGADGATTGRLKDKTIPLRRAALKEVCDFGHSRQGFLHDYNDGKMNGFYLEGNDCHRKALAGPYQYVNPHYIVPYWYIAKHYVLADHMFQTQGSGSFTAHQDLIRGGTGIDRLKTHSLVDIPTRGPWGCDAPARTKTPLLIEEPKKLKYQLGPFPCSDDFPGGGKYYPTLRDLLDASAVSWKYYTASLGQGDSGNLWDAFDLVAPVRYGSEWKKNMSKPETNIFKDIAAGKLAAMSWVIPDLQNSDHPSSGSDTGPSWVASVVNAIGESPYWSSTAIVIVWDDWGGFYDHEPPPFFDRWGGLGFRVPMLVVSPYARKTSSSQPGYISHTQYEFGSILKFIEHNWRLGSLYTTDARAASIADCFDFTQEPRKFKKIPSRHSQSYFERQIPSYKPVDTE